LDGLIEITAGKKPLAGMQTIIWDVDDVLNDLTREWFMAQWLPEHSGCAVRFEELTRNPPHALLGTTEQDYLTSLDSFRLSDAGRDLPPNREVLAWFEQEGARFRHVALTATPLMNAQHAASWVLRYFGRWIRTFAFVPSPRPGDPPSAYDRSKKEFLAWWGRADILIDDSPSHTAAAAQLGIRTFLVSQPWSRGGEPMGDILEALNIASP
jgi:hypothetical protein